MNVHIYFLVYTAQVCNRFRKVPHCVFSLTFSFPIYIFLTKLYDKCFPVFLIMLVKKILDLCKLHKKSFLCGHKTRSVASLSINTVLTLYLWQSSIRPLLREKNVFLISQEKEGRPRGCTYKSRILSHAAISYFVP